MVAENCKLKEELLQEKHGNELRSQQIRALTREKEAEKTFEEKLKVWYSEPGLMSVTVLLRCGSRCVA